MTKWEPPGGGGGGDEVVSINLQERGGRCIREVQVVYSNVGQENAHRQIPANYKYYQRL